MYLSTCHKICKVWDDFWAVSIDRKIELGLALAIAIFAFAQVWVAWDTAKGNTAQTEQLISAAKISSYAAQQNVRAASDFAGSAKSINQGIGHAVDRLNLQAEATAELARTAISQSNAAGILASAASKSAATAEQALAREIALDTPVISIQRIRIAEYPTNPNFYITFDVQNSGRTIATHARYTVSQGNYTVRQLASAEEMMLTSRNTFFVGGASNELPEILQSTPVPITLDLRQTASIPHAILDEFDEYYFYVGKIEFEDTYGDRYWKNFCINLAPYAKEYRKLDFKLTYCKVGQGSGKYPRDNARH